MFRYRCGKKAVPLCLLAILVFLLYRYGITWLSGKGSKPNRINLFPKVRNSPVLIYQPDDSHTQHGSIIFHKKGCQIRNCLLTTIEGHKYTADVIVFGENSAWEPPSPRLSSQFWIIRLLESPANTNSLTVYDGKVNATISYRLDSDLPVAYGQYESFVIPQTSAAKLNFAEGKTRMVCWIVSNCFTNNHRMEYARRLARYIQVDIFGACGKRSLNKPEAHRMIREHYKFYLAFENSNCHQYITEKFWINALRNDAVPIVMGAPKSDYLRVAPPNSFIHVDDYTPEQLSRYLQYLDRNQTAYNEYFVWKKYGRVADSDYYCRLCAFVQSPPQKIYSSVDRWWQDSEDCEKYAR
uniref:Fucosyltransferase n=1 Tax=Haemonchus contortus TaxID=6289 RepID=A0A7I4Z1Y4_HAECO